MRTETMPLPAAVNDESIDLRDREGAFSIAFDEVPGAEFYEIAYRPKAGGGWETVKTDRASRQRIGFQNLPAVILDVRVRAGNDNGYSPWSRVHNICPR